MRITRLLLCAICCCLAFSEGLSAAPQKNVLFIAVDDLRVELGCYGSEVVKSPNIDKLASQGTLFNRAYCQQTVCNPSRASMLTGLRPDTLKVWDLPTHFRTHHPQVVTLPQLFKQNGYHAQCVGKIFHNWRQEDHKGDARSWSVPEFLHYNTHGNDKPKVDGTIPQDVSSPLSQTECRDVPDNAYYDGRVADKAVETLKELKPSKEPFFLAVGFWKPHLPFNAPKKYWDMYDRSEIPIPDNLNPPENVPEIALTKYRIDRLKEKLPTEDIRELHHAHLAAISYLDTQVGKVLDELDAQGLRDETIIVFWSDHGLHIGEHGLWSKTTAFDLDARVPMIISTPEFNQAQQTDSLVELLDLYPTLTDLCSLEAPKGLEGKSLVPILKQPTHEVKEVALTQTPRPNYPRGKSPQVMGYTIRAERFRYTEWRDFQSEKVVARELYDHNNDPGETVNVINQKKFTDEIAHLEKQLQRAVKSGK